MATTNGASMLSNSAKGWTLVTGATAGLGKALVARLAAEGRNVIAAARNPADVDVPPGGGRVEPLRLDLADPAAIAEALRETSRIVAADGLSGLVNMAGVIVEGPLEGVPTEELRRQFDVNVIGPTVLTQGLLPLLAQTRGVIVNIGAISARLAPPFYGPIAASKAALAAINDAMRLEFAPLGVRVFLIEPGAMRTGIFERSRAARDAWLRGRPDLEQRYRGPINAMEAAFRRAGADDPRVVVDAVRAILCSRSGKPRAIVGKGARGFVLLSRLPIALRDSVLRSALGLKELLRPAY